MPSKQSVTEVEAREVAEGARDSGHQGRSALREIFLGNLPLDGVSPYPNTKCDRPEFVRWLDEFRHFLETRVNPEEIDRAGEYPVEVIEGLRELGAFGMKIPEAYGGLGFSQQEYCRAMELLGTYCGNLVALLSAHQSIGVPQHGTTPSRSACWTADTPGSRGRNCRRLALTWTMWFRASCRRPLRPSDPRRSEASS